MQRQVTDPMGCVAARSIRWTTVSWSVLRPNNVRVPFCVILYMISASFLCLVRACPLDLRVPVGELFGRFQIGGD
ncbi:hypothetical protein RA210_U250045 [Rubrivivax sp. A210]|nr:hypothetical protein RA210_U250045 [Rubrivivax sp. A210]